MSRRLPRELELDIEDLDAEGLGHATFEERRLLVRNALPGERVTARVLKRRRGTWYAEAPTAPASVAPARVDPACRYFPRCGGCAMQHLAYDVQVSLKAKQLQHELGQAGVSVARWRDPVLGPRFGYRTKARLGVRQLGEVLLVGFRESFSNRVARMDDCRTLTPQLAALVMPLRELVAGLSIPARVPQIELAAGDSDAAFVLRHLDPLTEADRDAVRGFARQHGVSAFLQSGGYDDVERLMDVGSGQAGTLGYAVPEFGIHLEFMPWDFTQVNLVMNRRLLKAALLALAAPPDAQVLDLFCGIGNFSLALAAAGSPVIGLEASAASVARACANATRNGLADRCEFRVVDLYDPACELNDEASHVLLDPPRSGAGPNLQRWMEQLRAARIAYVSCNPPSFASDARVLQDSGYALAEAGIFDMFPHTAHVETLGLFVRS